MPQKARGVRATEEVSAITPALSDARSIGSNAPSSAACALTLSVSTCASSRASNAGKAASVPSAAAYDRTSVVGGKSVAGRVELDGGGISKKKKNTRQD